MKRTTGPAGRTGINPPFINITQVTFSVKAHFLLFVCRLNPCRKFVNHDLSVVYLFSVNNKPAVADRVEEGRGFLFVIYPCFNAIQNKYVVFFYVVNYTALNVGITFFYERGLDR